MSDALVHAELLAACSALGYSDGAAYHREADCLETTKDLVRYLRRDDESHEVRRALGDTRVLQTDLLPLVRDHSSDTEQFDVTVRLLVNLTNPVLLLFREELPEEKVTRQQFLQLVTQQQRYKEAFVEERVWNVLVGRLGELLQLDWEHRQEEDRLLVERILILIRNVLSVPASPEDEKRTDDDSSVHDQVLWALHLAGLEDLLLYVASSQSEQDLCMHVLEIISLMLREQDPAQLAQAGLHRSDKEKEKDEKELLEVRRREALQRQQQRNKYYGARHSRFGGTYYVQNMKSISDRDLISHQPLTDIKSLNFDRSKRPKKHPKHRKPMKDIDTTRRSTLAIRLMLQEFCIEFLNGAYNSIMYIVKDNLSRARAQEHDESYYLWAMRFFMAFNRYHQFKVELISETLSVETFHYIQTQLENYFETMATDKKKIPLWSRRMHKALRAYQELLMTLAAMDKSEVSGVRESSRVLKSRVFYVVEYREMILLLLQNYNPIKMSLTYLKDVVETAHIFLKLLEGFCSKNRHLVVQKKAKKPKKKKCSTVSGQVEEMTEEKLQDMWDEMAGEVSAWVQGEAGDLPDTIPFDALSEDPEEEQKEAAMRRINKLLRDKELAEAVSLMRSAREVWPAGDVFGAANMDPSDEFLALREVFMANLNPPQPTAEAYNEEEEEEEHEEEEEEERMMQISEQEFSFKDFIRRFANSKVVEAYSKLLETYQTNSSQTNHCILKLFHRIAWDSKLPAMFFQASLFVTFQCVMEDPQSRSSDTVREIAKFAKYIIRQFFKVLETNPKVYMELMFWKTNKEALEIECGYGDVEMGSEKKAWCEEEEEELRRLYEEMNALPMEERGGKDLVDLVLENLISQSRSRRAIIKKMKELGLIKGVRELKGKPTQLRAPREWTEEEEAELRILFEEHKDAMDIVGRITDNKVLQRPKNRVVEKILELGLVADKKQLRKKRPKKVKPKVGPRGLGEKFIAANQGSDDDDGGGDGDSGEGSEQSDSESDDEQLSQTQKQAVRKLSGPATYDSPVATPALISAALKEAVEAGMVEAVTWLAGVITEVANDREEDGDFEPVPILAITEACTDAMEDPKFHKLMHMVGLQQPQNHQEMFWRVPSRLTVAALRKRALYLTQGAAGDPIETEQPDEPLEPIEVEPAVEKSTKAKSSKKAKEEKMKSITSKKKRKLRTAPSETEVLASENKENHYGKEEHINLPPSHTDSRMDNSDDDIPALPSSLSIPSSMSQKRSINSEDDSSCDTENTPSTQSKRGKKKKKRLMIVEDSDDESQTQAPKSQCLVLHLDTEPTERVADTPLNISPKSPSGQKLLASDDDDDDDDDDDGDVSFAVGRQRVRTVVESDEDE